MGSFLFPSCIVGAGPVGLTAALEAKRLGLSVRIIDRKPKRSAKDSRAIVVHPRVMELLGSNKAVTKAITDNSFNPDGVFFYQKKWFSSCSGDDALDDFSLNFKEVNWGDTDYPRLYFLPQYETERILEEALNKAGGRVEYGTSLENLEQTDDSVIITLKTDDGKSETVVSRWVVGADGGRSKTRELAGIEMNRHVSDAHFVAADIALKGKPPLRSRGDGKCIHVFPSGQGMNVFLPIAGKNAYRFFAQAPEGITSKDQVTIDETFLEKFLKERTGLDFGLELLGSWNTIFKVTHGISDSHVRGNVILAGDASHVHSPVGGQGMNLGMQDVMNLLWKLAWAKRVEEKAGDNDEIASVVETIVGSYHTERHTLGQELVDRVEFGTKILTTRNQIVQSIRNFAMKTFLTSDRAKDDFRQIGQLELAYPPECSKLIFENEQRDDHGGSFLTSFMPATKAKRAFIARPGQRVPNIRLDDGTRLYSHLDRSHHTWLHLNSSSNSVYKTETAADFANAVQGNPAENSLQASVPSIPVEALTAQQVLLIRPDQFVAGVGETKEELLNQLKDAVLHEEAIATM